MSSKWGAKGSCRRLAEKEYRASGALLCVFHWGDVEGNGRVGVGRGSPRQRTRNEVTAVQVQILDPGVGVGDRVEARTTKVVSGCFGTRRDWKRGHRGLFDGWWT